MSYTFSDADIDKIIEEVDATLQLAKSAAAQDLSDGANGGLKKDALPPEQEESQAPAEEAPAEPEHAEEAPEADDNISDEELIEIYQHMPPEERERHFMLLRHVMEQEMEQPQAEPEQAPEQPEEQPQAEAELPKSEMKEEEKEDEKKEEEKEDKEKAEKKEKPMKKSEDSEKLSSLEKENEELKKSLEKLVGVLDVAFKPVRKSVAGMEFIQKGEQPAPQAQVLSKSQKIEKLNELTKSQGSKLTKSDREAINDFVLRDGSEEKINQLLNLGGK